MQKAAKNGPIVIVNISMYRCNAFIFKASEVGLVNLSQITRSSFDYRSPRSYNTFIWLWETIVSPVLTKVAPGPPHDGPLLYIWWIPTGPLVHYPLHAAGKHLTSSIDTALNRVISSYSPSLEALVYFRYRNREVAANQASQKVVLVGMDNTPERLIKHLSSAIEEVDVVEKLCINTQLQAIRPERRTKQVLSAFGNCQIFHFSGQSDIHFESPLLSSLLLEDWLNDLLTVERLLRIDFASKSLFFAYLSADGTRGIKHLKAVDKGFHLIAAYQLAGFRYVIGSLWRADDRICVDITRKTYEALQKGGVLSNEAVSRSLHLAMRKLRDQWVQVKKLQRSLQASRSGRDATLAVGAEVRMPLWVPYVHFSV